jgi:hypothetical protein
VIKNLLLIFSLLIFSMGNFAWANGACKADKEKYCAQCTKEDKECMKKCVKENKKNFSAECKKHMEKKRKSKDKRSEWDKKH